MIPRLNPSDKANPFIVESLFDGLAAHLGGWCGAIGAENTADGGVLCEMEIFLPPDAIARARETLIGLISDMGGEHSLEVMPAGRTIFGSVRLPGAE